MTRPSILKLSLIVLLTPALMAVCTWEVLALIEGGEGNNPINNRNWPKGAAAVFDVQGRIAYWVGPPFGGGQWHAECRGDATAFNAVLANFAKLDVKSKRVVIHDGVGYSFWLAPNQEPAKLDAAKIDWSFMVWEPASWERLRSLPADLNPTLPGDDKSGPPSQIDVYVGGSIRWADVKVPKELKVVDQRLESHGFTMADGVVLEGKVLDAATAKPISGKMRLERIEPQKQGGYKHVLVAEARADGAGRWVLKKAPAGWFQIVIEAEGYVSRIAGYARFDKQPCWHEYGTRLSRPATVSGRVTDEANKPVADVDVRFDNIVADSGERYQPAQERSLKTDAEGRFRTDQVPIGTATIWIHKKGYTRPGLGLPIVMPRQDIALSLMKAGRVVVTVAFPSKERPVGYMVHIEPEGGEAIGKYGGAGNINKQDQMIFEDVPPGHYTFWGQPNPTTADQKSVPFTLEIKGGQTTNVRVNAK